MTKAQNLGEATTPTFVVVEKDYLELVSSNDAKREKLKQIQSDLRVIVGSLNGSIGYLSGVDELTTATFIAKIRDSVMEVAGSTTNIVLCKRDIQKRCDPFTQQLTTELERARQHISKLNDRLAIINTVIKTNFLRSDVNARFIVDTIEGHKDRE